MWEKELMLRVTQMSGPGLRQTSDFIRACFTGMSLKCFSRLCRKSGIYLIRKTAAGDNEAKGRQACCGQLWLTWIPHKDRSAHRKYSRSIQRGSKRCKLTWNTWAHQVFVEVREAEALPGSQPGSWFQPGNKKVSRAAAFIPPCPKNC